MPGSGWLLTSIEERRTRLSRPGPDARDHLDIVVAANLDALIIVASIERPVFHPRFIDRFLVTAQLGGVEPTIFLNKCDLVPEKDLIDLEVALRLGVDYIALSFVRGAADVEQVRAVKPERSTGGRYVVDFTATGLPYVFGFEKFGSVYLLSYIEDTH